MSLIALGLGALAPSTVNGQGNVFFTETMGNPTNSITSIQVHQTSLGFDNSATGVYYDGTGDIRKSYTSDGFYGTAPGGQGSGTANAFLNYGKTLTMTNVNTSGRSNIVLGFGLYKHKSSTTPHPVKVYYKNGAGAKTEIPFTIASASGWEFLVSTSTIPASNSLELYFENNSPTIQYRIDDIRIISDACGVTTPTVRFNGSAGATSGSVCQGATFSLFADVDANCTYQWQRNGVNISGASGTTTTAATIRYDAPLNADVADATYSITVKKIGGPCAITDDFALTVNPSPAAVTTYTTSGSTKCKGETITGALPSGTTSFKWYYKATSGGTYVFLDNQPAANIAAPAQTLSQPGFYALQVQDASSCKSPLGDGIQLFSAPATPIVNNLNSPVARKIYTCETSQILSITNAATYAGQSPTYQWKLAPTYSNESGATNSTYQPADQTSTKTYKVQVTVNECPSLSDDVILFKADKPAATTAVNDITPCEGTPLILSATVTDDGNSTAADNLSYVYLQNGTAVSTTSSTSSTTDTYTIASAVKPVGLNNGSNGDYTVKITNEVTGCLKTFDIAVDGNKVEVKPATHYYLAGEFNNRLDTPSNTFYFCPPDGENTQLIYLVNEDDGDERIQNDQTGGSPYTLAWKLASTPGTTISDAGDFEVGGLDLESGAYIVNITHNVNCPATIPFNLSIVDIGTPTFTVTPVSASVCYNNALTIAPNNTSGLSYSYTTNGKASNTNNVLSLTYGGANGIANNATTSQPFTFPYVATHTASGCTVTGDLPTVTVQSTPAVPTVTVQTNKNRTFNSIGATNINYYWANNTIGGTAGKTDVLNLNTADALISATGTTTASSIIRYYINDSLISSASNTATGGGTFAVLLNKFNDSFNSASSTATTTYTLKATASNGTCTSGASTARNIIAFNISPSSNSATNVSVCGKTGGLNANQQYNYNNFATTPPSGTLTLGACPAGATTLGRGGNDLDVTEVAAETAVAQGVVAYPNPFKEMVTIQFFVAQESNVTIMITDMLGRIVKVYAPEAYTAGVQKITWDGLAASGAKLPVGIYNVKVAAGDDVSTTRVMLTE